MTPLGGATQSGFEVEAFILLFLIVVALAVIAINRQLAVRKLVDSEKAFRDLYESINEGVFRSTLGGRMISANPYLVRLNGFDSEEQMLREVNDIAGEWYVDPNRRAEIHAMLVESGKVSGLVSEVYRYRTRERIWIEENTRLVRDQRTWQPLYYDGTVREVTETVRRLELQARQEKIASVISGCLYQQRMDPDGKHKMTYMSIGLVNLFGITPEEAIADAAVLTGVVHPDDLPRLMETFRQSAANLTPRECEYRIIARNGVEKWVFGRSVPERQADGSILWHGFIADVTERKRSEAEIYKLAYFDPLTGLPNRTMLLDDLNHALAVSAGRRTWGALLFIDLDQFKLLNDTKGHHAGDRLLRAVAERLKVCADRTAFVARFGGDEFVILCRNLGADRDEAEEALRGLGATVASLLAAPFELEGSWFEATASIGIAMFRGNDTAEDELLKQADVAMYAAKAVGPGLIRFFKAPMQEALEARLLLRNELREAIGNGELLLVYQPLVDGNRRCFGAEALVRWRHPERGVIEPAAFLGVVDQPGLAAAIDAFVLRTACATLRAWRDRPETARIGLSVNISAHQLSRPEFVATVAATLLEADADPSLLTLELTEHVMLDNVAEVSRSMGKLKAMGVKLALDDFGTGYSSLSYLKQLPFDILKIDRSFVSDLETDPSDRAIVQTILNIAQSLKVSVIAEGVETELQMLLLRQLGCHAYQGYYFARPMSLEDFGAYAAAAPADSPPRERRLSA